jgi:hypothetical protein
VKRCAALLILLLGACEPEKKDPTIAAVKEFQDWVHAAAAGNGEKVFAGMSTGFKSGWLYDSLTQADPAARRWRGELTGLARTDLDLWLGVAKKRNDGRQEALPTTVLTHPSLKALFVETYAHEVRLQQEMARVEIAQAYADDSGVTVAVKNGAGSTEMYGLIPEGDGWKVDAHRDPLSPGR